MKKTILALLFLSCCCFSTFAQTVYTLVDTVVANRLLKECDEAFNAVFELNKMNDIPFQKSQYGLAVAKIDTAQLIFGQIYGNESKQNYIALNRIINTLDEHLKMHSSLKGIDYLYTLNHTVLNISKKLYGEESLETAKAYFQLGSSISTRNTTLALNKTDSNFIFFNRALVIYAKISGENTPEVAKIHLALGQSFMQKSSLNQAIGHLEKTIAIYSMLGDDAAEKRLAYTICSNVSERQLKFEQAYKYRELALNTSIKKYGGENHRDVAYDYLAIGRIANKVYDFDKALHYANKALKIAKKVEKITPPTNGTPGDMPSLIPSINASIIDIYRTMGDYDKALELLYLTAKEDKRNIARPLAEIFYIKGEYDKALNLSHRVWETDKSPGVAYELSRNYIAKGEYHNVIKYVKESIEWSKKTTQRQWLMEAHLILGESYCLMNQYDKAIDAYQEALKLYEEKFGLDYKLDTYEGIANCYEKWTNYDSAHYYYQKILDINTEKLGKRNLRNIKPLNDLGRIAEKKKDFNTANNIYATTLKEQGFEDTKNVKYIFENEKLLDFLASKAAFECRWYLETGDRVHLETSSETYRQTFIAFDNQNKLFFSEGAKTDQKKKYYTLYEGAIETSRLLKTTQGLDKAFAYNERSKASLLQSQLKESSALRFANIPDTLLEREKMLRLTITSIEKGRQERMNESKSELDSFNVVLAIRADSFRTLYADLKKTFEKNYPDYYRLKYDYKTVDIAEVQQKLLSKEQTMLSYFVGDSSIYAFVVRPDTFAVFDFKKDFPLESWIKQLRDGLYGYHTANIKTEKLYEMKADSFATAAFQLQQKLITPLSNLLTKELIIVPDGVLGYVPFDVLLTEKPKEANEFNKHNYFGKNHIISYNYSATLWQEMRNKKHKVEPKKPFIGFAPFYDGDTTLLSNLFSHDVAMRKGLDSLKNSGEEVFKAQKLMRGESIMDKKATKETFEKIAGDYRIVHLATHGKANDKIGDYCFLAFTEQKDSLQNELLYVRDIYNLSLNADLVVLSACETGIGELKRGEGIVSLSRAFAYAGAKSMVTTLWSVNDKSTMQLMEGFYRQLKEGKTKDYALWKAKQDYLKKAKDEMAHPFFWSAFIPMGDMSAMKK